MFEGVFSLQNLFEKAKMVLLVLDNHMIAYCNNNYSCKLQVFYSDTQQNSITEEEFVFCTHDIGNINQYVKAM